MLSANVETENELDDRYAGMEAKLKNIKTRLQHGKMSLKKMAKKLVPLI